MVETCIKVFVVTLSILSLIGLYFNHNLKVRKCLGGAIKKSTIKHINLCAYDLNSDINVYILAHKETNCKIIRYLVIVNSISMPRTVTTWNNIWRR